MESLSRMLAPLPFTSAQDMPSFFKIRLFPKYGMKSTNFLCLPAASLGRCKYLEKVLYTDFLTGILFLGSGREKMESRIKKKNLKT